MVSIPDQIAYLKGVKAATLRAEDAAIVQSTIDTLMNVYEAKQGEDNGNRFISISADGSTHTRTAEEWLTISREAMRR